MTRPELDEFRLAVYEVVRMVPRGRATSYGAIAHAVGYPGFSRLVGRVMGECNEYADEVPAHRVVNSHGVLSGSPAFGAPGRMAGLLEQEGVEVVNSRIANWRKVFWNPQKEIDIP